MRVDYLKAIQSGVVAADGTVTLVQGPANSQFWFPTYMTVGTILQTVPFATAVVYEGQAGIYDQTTYVDDTLFGFRDTSSVISGTMIQQGEVYTAQFAGAKPGDTAVFTVYGLVSDVPLAEGVLIPSVPGTQFRGHNVVTNAVFINQGQLLMAANSVLTLGTFNLSAFQSFNLALSALTSSGPTTFNGAVVEIDWWNDVALTQFMYSQGYEIGSQQTGVLPESGGQFYLQDQCHGNFAKVTYTNWGADQKLLAYTRMIGTSRMYGAPYAVETSSVPIPSPIEIVPGERGYLLAEALVIAASATHNWGSLMGVGQCQVRFSAGAAGPLTLTWWLGQDVAAGTPVSQPQSVAVNTSLTFTMWVPSCPVFFRVINTAAAPSSYSLLFVRELSPSA